MVRVNSLIDKAKKAYYREELAEVNTKTVFKKVYSLLNRNVKILPVYNSPTKTKSQREVSNIYGGLRHAVYG